MEAGQARRCGYPEPFVMLGSRSHLPRSGPGHCCSREARTSFLSVSRLDYRRITGKASDQKAKQAGLATVK